MNMRVLRGADEEDRILFRNDTKTSCRVKPFGIRRQSIYELLVCPYFI